MENKKITSHQLYTSLIALTVITSIFTLPFDIANISRQDTYISVAIASLYGAFLVITGLIISTKYPEDNLLIVSKKIFGKFIGNLFNGIFCIGLFLKFVLVVDSDYLILRDFVLRFLTLEKIVFVFYVVAIIAVYQGVRPVAKISEFLHYFLLLILIMPVFVLNKGDVSNLTPVGSSGIRSILTGAYNAIYIFSPLEGLFILYPYLDDKSKLKKTLLSSFIFIAAAYIWVSFACIYVLGYEVTMAYRYPLLKLVSIVKVPLINNYKYLYLIMWTEISLRSISLNLSVFSVSLKTLVGNLWYKYIFALFIIGGFIFQRHITNLSLRNFYIKNAYVFIGFDAIFIFAIAIVIFIKTKGKGKKETAKEN